MNKIKSRLDNNNDNNWALIATPCVHSGVDFSFRTGFMECCGYQAASQLEGRIDRNVEYGGSRLFIFELIQEGLITHNNRFDASVEVFKKLKQEGFIKSHNSTECSTEAFRRELLLKSSLSRRDEIIKAEKSFNFPEVKNKFVVINEPGVLVLIDPCIVETIEKWQWGKGEPVNYAILQKHSVSIRTDKEGRKIADYELSHMKPIDGFPEIYKWLLGYDKFIGYMRGVINKRKSEEVGIQKDILVV